MIIPIVLVLVVEPDPGTPEVVSTSFISVEDVTSAVDCSLDVETSIGETDDKEVSFAGLAVYE